MMLQTARNALKRSIECTYVLYVHVCPPLSLPSIAERDVSTSGYFERVLLAIISTPYK